MARSLLKPVFPAWFHFIFRVVNAAGRLAPGSEQEQAQRLRAEGVQVVGGRVIREK